MNQKPNYALAALYGLASGLTSSLVFNWLPYILFRLIGLHRFGFNFWYLNMAAIVMAVLFVLVLFLPYKDGPVLSEIKIIWTDKKRLVYSILCVAGTYLIQGPLRYFSGVYIYPDLKIFNGGFESTLHFSIPLMFLGVIFFILLAAMGRFRTVKWIKLNTLSFTESVSESGSEGMKSFVQFPDQCFYCGEKAEKKGKMKLERSDNMWVQMFSKEKKIAPLQIPYCGKHASESKIFHYILQTAYIAPVCLIIADFLIRGFRADFFEILAVILYAHFVSTFIQWGARSFLTPLFPNINGFPLAGFNKGMIGRQLGIKIIAKPERSHMQAKIINPSVKDEFVKLNS